MSEHAHDRLAGIQYVGLAGVSRECRQAVMRLIQFGDLISQARIISCSSQHCLLLTVGTGDLIAVKSGFGSGYLGEGPHALSCVLRLLEALGVQIEEFDVSADFLERIDASSLTAADLTSIEQARPVRPLRWQDYVRERHWDAEETVWREFPPIIPYAAIDSRIIDLAKSFWTGPDERLLTGYRRLEDLVRGRTALEAHGAKLFTQAFDFEGGKLTWGLTDRGEHQGRVNLFAGTYAAFRNPRAHRELGHQPTSLLSEFMTLNQLFLFERIAHVRIDQSQSGAPAT